MSPLRVVTAAALSMLFSCGMAEVSVGDEADKDVTSSTGKKLTVAAGEMYPAPHASLSLAGLSPAAPKTAAFSYHPSGATTPSDKYRLIQLPSLPIGRALKVSVDSEPDGATDPVISIVDGAFDVLVSDDDSGPGSNAEVTYTFTRSSAYAVLVREYRKAAGTFRVTVRDLSTGGGGGGGGTDVVLNAAQGLTQSAMMGGLSLPASRSVSYRSPPNLRAYTLSLSAGQRLDVQVTSTTGDAYAFLFGAGPGYALLASDDDGGGNRNSHLVYDVAQTGVYYVALRDYNLREATFQLTVTVAGTHLATLPTAPTSVSATSPAANVVRLRYEVPYSSGFELVSGCRAEDTATGRQYAWPLSYNLDWSSTQRSHTHDLANVPPGSRAFRVQCQNVAGWGPWSLSSGTVTVTDAMNPAYQTPTAATDVVIERFEPDQGYPPSALVVRFYPGWNTASYTTACEGNDTVTGTTYSWPGSYYQGSRALVRASSVTVGDHAFRVRCRNTYGWGPWSATSPTFHVSVLSLPRAPTTPAATVLSYDPRSVRLTFDVADYSSSSITTCKVQDVYTQNIVQLTSVSWTTTPSLTAAAGTHAYRVACFNVNGWGPWSPQSNSVVVQ